MTLEKPNNLVLELSDLKLLKQDLLIIFIQLPVKFGDAHFVLVNASASLGEGRLILAPQHHKGACTTR